MCTFIIRQIVRHPVKSTSKARFKLCTQGCQSFYLGKMLRNDTQYLLLIALRHIHDRSEQAERDCMASVGYLFTDRASCPPEALLVDLANCSLVDLT